MHESLLNVAVDPEVPFWLVCPYDVARLDASIIAEAHRSHPAISNGASYRGSSSYGGRAHADTMFESPLPPLVAEPATFAFARHNLAQVFPFVTMQAYAAMLWSDKVLNLASAVRLLAASSLRRGAERGAIRVWNTPDALVCEIFDVTLVGDLLAGRRAPTEEDSDSLWSANQLCDLVQLRSSSSGTAVRLHAWK